MRQREEMAFAEFRLQREAEQIGEGGAASAAVHTLPRAFDWEAVSARSKAISLGAR